MKFPRAIVAGMAIIFCLSLFGAINAHPYVVTPGGQGDVLNWLVNQETGEPVVFEFIKWLFSYEKWYDIYDFLMKMVEGGFG